MLEDVEAAAERGHKTAEESHGGDCNPGRCRGRSRNEIGAAPKTGPGGPMSNLNLSPVPTAGSTDTRMEIDATRGRQTEPPATPFRSVLAGGVSLLMTGAEVATHVVGGPVLAAAVHDAR